jgi:hypothetical protein
MLYFYLPYISRASNADIYIACIPLLRPLIKAVAKSGIYTTSSRSMWIRTRSVPEGVDEIPLGHRVPEKLSLDDVESHSHGTSMTRV